MNYMIMLKVAGPMVVLSLLLLTVGVLAAINVQEQHRTNSELIAREVTGMLAAEDVFIVMRDIRRELDLYLRTHEQQNLDNVGILLRDADAPIESAKRSARTEKELELVHVVDVGYHNFVDKFAELCEHKNDPDSDRGFAELNDVVLSNKILNPTRECIGYNRQVVALAANAGEVSSQQMRLGFLLLGITGSIAGLLFGLGIARALSRSIVQLDVSVRGVAGKLHELGSPVRISHLGDLQGLEFSVRNLESEIGDVVERLQSRELELLRSEQLAIVGQLAAGMAHELRNPLMPIKILVQAAMEKGPEEGVKGQELEIVYEELVRLEHSIQAFLDFARPPALEVVQLELNMLLQKSVDLITPQAIQRHVRIVTHLPNTSVMSRIDGTQMRQVLLNLLLNSLDALPNGGVIEVSLETHAYDAPTDPLQIEEAPDLRMGVIDPQYYAIYIRDTGPGFPPEPLANTFKPFITTKETGTGLGLSICHRIVTAHGGTIRLTNRPKGGAEVCIRLPYIRASAQLVRETSVL